MTNVDSGKESILLLSDGKENAVASAPPEAKEAEATAITESAAAAAAAAAAPPAVPQPPKGCRKQNYEKDVVYLYQFSRTQALPSISPFCLKVETWLRLNDVKYENVDHKMRYKSKKGQLPFVELNGEEIADSTVIISELNQRFDKGLDSKLDRAQKSVSHAMISMIENHLFWVVMWWRAKYPDSVIRGYQMNLQHFLGTKLPAGVLNLFFKYNYARKGLKKLKIHGIGLHTAEEIDDFAKNDLKVLSDVLGDKPYYFGEEPSLLDIVAFATLAQIYFVGKEVEYPLRDYMIENFPNLVEHLNRLKESCFPDWEEMCKTLDLNTHLPKPVVPEEKEANNIKGEDKKRDVPAANAEKAKEDADIAKSEK